MAKLPHSSMTVFQLKHAIDGYTATLAKLEKVPQVKDANTRKLFDPVAGKKTRYRSLLRTAEFTLQRKQDALAATGTKLETLKGTARRLLMKRFQTHLMVPFSRLDHEAIFRDTQTFIQNYNS